MPPPGRGLTSFSASVSRPIRGHKNVNNLTNKPCKKCKHCVSQEWAVITDCIVKDFVADDAEAEKVPKHQHENLAQVTKEDR